MTILLTLNQLGNNTFIECLAGNNGNVFQKSTEKFCGFTLKKYIFHWSFFSSFFMYILLGPITFSYDGHGYFYSGDVEAHSDDKVDWLEARNICREYCMDLVSIETPSENDLIEELISGGMRMLPTYSVLEMGKKSMEKLWVYDMCWCASYWTKIPQRSRVLFPLPILEHCATAVICVRYEPSRKQYYLVVCCFVTHE